jgi:hypothetical protein
MDAGSSTPVTAERAAADAGEDSGAENGIGTREGTSTSGVLRLPAARTVLGMLLDDLGAAIACAISSMLRRRPAPPRLVMRSSPVRASTRVNRVSTKTGPSSPSGAVENMSVTRALLFHRQECPSLLEVRPDDFRKPLREGGVQEAEAESPQPDVREHRLRTKIVMEEIACQESKNRSGQAKDAQSPVCEGGDGGREVGEPDWIVVHEKIPAADGAALGEVNQRASAVLNVDGRDPPFGLAELEDAAIRQDRLDHALTAPRAVPVHPPGERGDDRKTGDDVALDTFERGREVPAPG